jgi:hypothetical protein
MPPGFAHVGSTAALLAVLGFLLAGPEVVVRRSRERGVHC